MLKCNDGSIEVKFASLDQFQGADTVAELRPGTNLVFKEPFDKQREGMPQIPPIVSIEAFTQNSFVPIQRSTEAGSALVGQIP